MKRAKPQTAERYEAVKKLYFDSWGRLRDDALESNQHLTAGDAFDVVASLSSKLHLYPDRLMLTEDVFARWAASVLTQTVFLHGLIRMCETTVRDSIRGVLVGCGGLGVMYRTEDERGTEDEIASDTWSWAMTHIDDLLKVSPADLPARMGKAAYWQARAWKSRRVNEKNTHTYLDEMPLEERESFLQAVADSPSTPPAYLKAGASAVSPLESPRPLS